MQNRVIGASSWQSTTPGRLGHMAAMAHNNTGPGEKAEQSTFGVWHCWRTAGRVLWRLSAIPSLARCRVRSVSEAALPLIATALSALQIL